jgi:hypothetical protein
MPPMEQELLNLPEHPNARQTPFRLDYCFYPFVFSFDHCLFFDLRVVISTLVSSNFSHGSLYGWRYYFVFQICIPFTKYKIYINTFVLALCSLIYPASGWALCPYTSNSSNTWHELKVLHTYVPVLIFKHCVPFQQTIF